MIASSRPARWRARRIGRRAARPPKFGLQFDFPEDSMSERFGFFERFLRRRRSGLDFVQRGFLIGASFTFVARECDKTLPGVL
jgi:hypothetical protein